MADMKELLDRLGTAITKMEGDEADDASSDTDALVEMNEEKFIEHVASELEKAAAESGEIRKHRIAYVKSIVATVRKNFEGPTPGKISIPMFKSPDQQEPKTETPGSGTQSAATSFSANDAPQGAAGGAGNTPPGGSMPKSNASGGSTNFSKSVEKIESLLNGIGDKTPDGDSAGASASDGGDAKSKTQKSEDSDDDDAVMWPADMNRPMGAEEGAQSPWGADPKSVHRAS